MKVNHKMRTKEEIIKKMKFYEENADNNKDTRLKTQGKMTSQEHFSRSRADILRWVLDGEEVE